MKTQMRLSLHRMLTEHVDEVLGNRRDAQVFIPLCGKANEIKWFYDNGHRVAGLEYVEKTVRLFFEENKLSYVETTCPVINCKILQQTNAGEEVTSSSAFTLLKYISVMLSLMSPDSTYTLISVVYDDDSYTGKEMKLTKVAETTRKQGVSFIKAPISEVFWRITL
ncbi:hypothetical protein HPB47_002512 [Ixodes persulcatus]|uniref:Uncharacterized protein n=1 Tax=Ixodes persulcatus TaxID=34615 RepID=A0AC60PLF5_IXOPE|nr:hypothetical protein HPB47_002512 [Ixodes persulcatus]